MSENTNAVDYVRSRRETAERLNLSVRTLSKLERLGQAPRRTQITERVIGYRDSAILEYLDSKTSA
jgi:predicted DNA-binding transcriptional regulator AlpA